MPRKTYQLNGTREGTWWIVAVAEVDYRTQAHTLREGDEVGRDLLAVALDVPADSFDVAIQVEGGYSDAVFTGGLGTSISGPGCRSTHVVVQSGPLLATRVLDVVGAFSLEDGGTRVDSGACDPRRRR